MKKFEDFNVLELDTIREIGSIGTGNAATALSGVLGCEVRITMPEVRIMGYNEAIDWIGGPEIITAGVLVRLDGELKGIMLSVQQLDSSIWCSRALWGRWWRTIASSQSWTAQPWWKWAIL